MAIGEASAIVPDKGVNILYRVVLNTLGNLTATGLTQDNTTGNTQKTNNSRLGTDTPKGILGGSVVAVDSTAGSGYVVAADGSSNAPVGIAENNAVGYPYESSSGVASGKLPYLSGSGSVFSTDVYETRNAANTADLTYQAGDSLYPSQNGLLTNEDAGGGVVVGVVLTAPSTSDPFMVVQLRI